MKEIGFFESEQSPGPVASSVEIIEAQEVRSQSTQGRQLQPDPQAVFTLGLAALG